MANPYNVSISVSAAVANGIAASQSLGAAGNLTINGSLASGGVATLSSANCRARRVIITSAGNDSASTWTITGTDAWGNTQSEIVAGGNAVVVSSVRDYATVTRIRGSGTTASTVTAGTSTVASTEWRVVDIFRENFNLGIITAVVGSVNYNVESTNDDPNAAQFGSIAPNSNIPPVATAYPVFLGATTGNNGNFEEPVFAVRATVNSGTGTLTMQLIQSGIGS